MLDIKFIKNNRDLVKKAIKDKQLESTVNLDDFISTHDKYNEILQKVENLRNKRNEVSDSLSRVMRDKDSGEKDELLKQAKEIKNELSNLEDEYKELAKKVKEAHAWIPNVPADDVPVGKDETENVVIRTEGEKKEFDFDPRPHYEIGENLGIIDIKRGTKIGGFRSYFIVNEGMLLEQAILKYALDHMIEQGFTPMNVPVMVDKEYLFGTGYFPWGEEDHYSVSDTHALTGTAEVALTSYHADEILNEEDLPVKLTGLSPCFRREVGSHGKDQKGVFRVHYFSKVEQVVLLPEGEEISREWHDKMLGYSEDILVGLNLPYEVMLMCTGDMGAGQRKKYDINTWFPSEKVYKETHSDSYFLDYQSRRLNMRYKNKKGETRFVSTINNTVAATPRLFAAVIENYQQKDGSVKVPKVLQKYTGFDVIKPKN